MSWKSLVTTGLLCVLASPVVAAPTMTLVKGGSVATNNLDASGNWVWNVQITPDTTLVPDSSGTPVAAELGFTSTSNLSGTIAGQGDVKSAANLSSGAGNLFDTKNPGDVIFGSWQTVGNGLLDPNSNSRPTGIQLNCPTCGTAGGPTGQGTSGSSYTATSSVGGTANQVFAALGSVNFPNGTNTGQNFVKIVTQRPVVSLAQPNTTSTITVSGASTHSNNGRLSQVTGINTGPPQVYTTTNYDTFNGVYTRTARGGDADLNGAVNFSDYQLAILLNYGQSGKTWQEGDFDGNGIVNFTDYQILLLTYGQTYTVGGAPLPASGPSLSSDGSTVPEPASIALVGLALLCGLGAIRRKR